MSDHEIPLEFEKVCDRYEFAPLVHLGISIARWLKEIFRGHQIWAGNITEDQDRGLSLDPGSAVNER